MNIQNVYINKISVFLPNDPIDNQTMEHILGQVGEKPSRARAIILKSNGIKTRYYAIDPRTRQATHSNSELAAQAIKTLYNDDLQAIKKMTFLACGTSYPDQIMPGHGVMVHGELKTSQPCEVHSCAGVCVAGMSALKQAYNAIKTGEHYTAIACASETASAVMRSENFQVEIEQKINQLDIRPEIAFEKDFLRWMLSDGAGAMQLSNQANPHCLSLKIHWIDLLSYANEMPACMYAGGDFRDDKFIGWKQYTQTEQQAQSLLSVKQNVKLLNENIVKYTVEKMLANSIKKHDLKNEQIDYFLPHYSSNYFRDKLYQGLVNIGFHIPYEKWFTNLSSKGNTGSASIYIILEEFIRTQSLKHGQKILCYIPESGRFSSCFMLLEVIHPNKQEQ